MRWGEGDRLLRASGSIQGLDKPILADAKPCFSEEEWQRVAEGYNTWGAWPRKKGCRFACTTHGNRRSNDGRDR
nr:inosose dehydratase [Raoultella sp. NCTC 9187]